LENGMDVPQVERDVLSTMMAYRWPGNVRELRNAVEFALIRCKDSKLRLHDLPPEITSVSTESGGRAAYSADSDKTRIMDALKATKGRRAEAAKLLGISRATLYRRMKACCLGDDIF
jgi:transcriptional regulator of acetoin/glycerol metabolism